MIATWSHLMEVRTKLSHPKSGVISSRKNSQFLPRGLVVEKRRRSGITRPIAQKGNRVDRLGPRIGPDTSSGVHKPYNGRRRSHVCGTSEVVSFSVQRRATSARVVAPALRRCRSSAPRFVVRRGARQRVEPAHADLLEEQTSSMFCFGADTG